MADKDTKDSCRVNPNENFLAFPRKCDRPVRKVPTVGQGINSDTLHTRSVSLIRFILLQAWIFDKSAFLLAQCFIPPLVYQETTSSSLDNTAIQEMGLTLKMAQCSILSVLVYTKISRRRRLMSVSAARRCSKQHSKVLHTNINQ